MKKSMKRKENFKNRKNKLKMRSIAFLMMMTLIFGQGK